MNNFTQRTITAIFYVMVIVLCLQTGTWPAFTLLAGFSLWGLLEYRNMLLKEVSIFQSILFVVGGVYIFSLIALWHFTYIQRQYYGLVLVLSILIFIIQLFYKSENPFDIIGRQITGWIYIPVSLGLLFSIGYLKFMYTDGNIAYNGFLVLSVFILIWANDTFAYLVGRWIGKTPLFSRISPKKTIEGTVGGVILSVIAAVGLFYWKGQFTLIEYIGLSFIISISSTLGDLVESMLKRSLNIKDSGTLMPGHGGILDRLDGTFITAWVVYFYLQLI